jgi:acetyltransferase
VSSNQLLAPLFEADRLAIIGASERNHYAVNIFKNLQTMGFDSAQIIPINPGRPEVFGLKAFPNITDVPGEIPLAVIAVNNKAVISVVRKPAEGIRLASSSPTASPKAAKPGKKLQRTSRRGQSGKSQALGPNCMGFVALCASWASGARAAE